MQNTGGSGRRSAVRFRLGLLGNGRGRLDAGLYHRLGNFQAVIHQVNACFIGKADGNQRFRSVIRPLQDNLTVSEIDDLQ